MFLFLFHRCCFLIVWPKFQYLDNFFFSKLIWNSFLVFQALLIIKRDLSPSKDNLIWILYRHLAINVLSFNLYTKYLHLFCLHCSFLSSLSLVNSSAVVTKANKTGNSVYFFHLFSDSTNEKDVSYLFWKVHSKGKIL